jgi:phage replication-related protein YjqB (UPF0714/DUF867 family)
MTDRKYASTTETFVHEATNHKIALSPHAGEIEPGTSVQTATVASEFKNWSAWSYAAEANGGSTFDKYHTASTEIDPSEYMYLAEALEHPFDLAVAFHGFAPSDTDIDIYVGGSIPLAQRQQLAERLQFETGFRTVAARPSDGDLWQNYSGTHRSNIVNRITAKSSEHSVQLEQCREPRRESAEMIARAVVEYFD